MVELFVFEQEVRHSDNHAWIVNRPFIQLLLPNLPWIRFRRSGDLGSIVGLLILLRFRLNHFLSLVAEIFIVSFCKGIIALLIDRALATGSRRRPRAENTAREAILDAGRAFNHQSSRRWI